MPTYDFICEGGHKTEDLVPYDVREIDCPQCPRISKRLFPAPAIWSDELQNSFLAKRYSTSKSAFIDPDVGPVNSKSELNEKLKEKGLRVKDKNSDKEAEANAKERWRKTVTEPIKEKVAKLAQEIPWG